MNILKFGPNSRSQYTWENSTDNVPFLSYCVCYATVHNKLIKSLMIAYVKMIQYTEACLIDKHTFLVW